MTFLTPFCLNLVLFLSGVVEFEAAFNLLVAVAIVDADKAVVEDILKIVVSEPTQKTALKFKVYDPKEMFDFSQD